MTSRILKQFLTTLSQLSHFIFLRHCKCVTEYFNPSLNNVTSFMGDPLSIYNLSYVMNSKILILLRFCDVHSFCVPLFHYFQAEKNHLRLCVVKIAIGHELMIIFLKRWLMLTLAGEISAKQAMKERASAQEKNWKLSVLRANYFLMFTFS